MQLLMYLVQRPPPHISKRVLSLFVGVRMCVERLRCRLTSMSPHLQTSYCIGVPSLGSSLVPVGTFHYPNPHPFGERCVDCSSIVRRDPFCRLLQSPPPMCDLSLLTAQFSVLCFLSQSFSVVPQLPYEFADDCPVLLVEVLHDLRLLLDPLRSFC